MEEAHPKVGLGVLVFKDGKVLLGKRKGSHGAGLYGCPGGKLDFGETLEECVAREVMEETGMTVKNIEVKCLFTLLKYIDENKHFLDIGVRADWESGEPEVKEPEKCEGWEWFDPEHPPENLFGGTGKYLESLKTGVVYAGTLI